MYPPRRGHGASHRKVGAPQIEVCDVTGMPVERASLRVSHVEGLRGQAVSDKTPFLRRVRSKPSYQDLRNVSSGRRTESVPRRLPPFGGHPWWRDVVVDEE